MKKILIANRGEIAIRVMRTAKKMGIKTVAVFSEADRNALHVKYADEAVCIGPAPSNESYLKGDKIIEISKSLNVDAIHPGYGFLSENADFAELCESNNIIFIGPRSKAIKVMGSKLAAKDTVKAYDIPMVPGTDEAITDIPEAKKIAKDIGFPILIKASAGGGGKGMRIVEKESEFESQMDRAISEAKNAFGDGSVFIEKYVASPRHIEIQVMADTHGRVIHLFERECSIQRRHQKVVEEAPSAVLTPELREKMGQAAINVARSCDYVGAGTVEFLLDENLNFYFLEMNTRLQVEHPVTEWITGVDLVELQIKVARGEKLDIQQHDLKINGHALELRVYAEDPMNDFLPSVGNLETYQLPEGDKIRVDNGFEEGMDIPIYYDPMLSKLITYGETREEAIEIMIKAIDNYHIKGVETTLSFGRFVCEHDAFRSGNFDTHFVKKYYSPSLLEEQHKLEAEIAAKIALRHYLGERKILRVPN
ncbi:acetyl-CoA carboxylase biotin carboxylase subunit [Winogradskyella bathintestinalis]|uniref:Acetyl-CoA carboxylase biotin carboxylase subunit n=1 Tax=Winogradskyella bathintestinalis TaxID=3035208 RepID=A0ABT7ZVX3_9FLAO|nr:acetyl-CoA carboxylase biotin carboxylase subunit [Winogradskyella bathintestinalis]MDN3493161.1 acetyl-CoA carboxylase biotin carboxylase subunit [Winogradskyella bathintestinalis]